MVGRLLLLAALGGCNALLGIESFPPSDATVLRDADGDAVLDAACAAKRWTADFATDPTTRDDNGDGTPDWRLRDGSVFPVAQLEGGVWISPATAQPLDTNPPQRFATKTHIEARLRGTNTAGGQFGGIVWINFGWDVALESYSAVLVDLRRMSDTVQRVRLYAKQTDGMFLVLSESMTGIGFVRVTLEVDPETRIVSFALPELGAALVAEVGPAPSLGGVFDGYVTTFGYDTSAEIDELSVAVCDR